MKTTLLALVAILLLPACVGAINLHEATPNTTKTSGSITDPVTPETRLPPPTKVFDACPTGNFQMCHNLEGAKRSAFSAGQLNAISKAQLPSAPPFEDNLGIVMYVAETVEAIAVYTGSVVLYQDGITLQNTQSFRLNVDFNHRRVSGGTGKRETGKLYISMKGNFNADGVVRDGYIQTHDISDPTTSGRFNAIIGSNRIIGNFRHADDLWAGGFEADKAHDLK